MIKIQIKDFFFNQLNAFYQQKEPFFFIINFSLDQAEVFRLSELASANIYYQTPHSSHLPINTLIHKPLYWQKEPIGFESYKQQFDAIQAEIQKGNTYLANLTCATPIQTNYSLQELFCAGQAKYKLFYKDQFIHFSPEPFIKIEHNQISSYPMKGTIDASIDNAEDCIMKNEKELNEQFTIVDLIRNDLSIVAHNVHVSNFRYCEKIQSNDKTLLAISSKIEGSLRAAYQNDIGAILKMILPAGSICGAPKSKTVDILLATEKHHRGFYTGVWGIFDGNLVDTCVIIRYLEKDEHNNYTFKSGGGITHNSIAEHEYQEMIDKVYVPIY